MALLQSGWYVRSGPRTPIQAGFGLLSVLAAEGESGITGWAKFCIFYFVYSHLIKFKHKVAS